MTDITPARANLQVEETDFNSAVSEALLQKMGGSVNFINDRQHSEKQFFLNGKYNQATLPLLASDGLVVFNFNATIINAYMFVLISGSGGVTELDIKRTTSSGGAFSSIFSTTPKISSSAGDFAYVGIGGSGSGLTAPVLSVTDVDAGDALRMDLISAQTGDVRSTGLIIHYRPR